VVTNAVSGEATEGTSIKFRSAWGNNGETYKITEQLKCYTYHYTVNSSLYTSNVRQIFIMAK
jgi:hypothetical protein